MNTRELLTLYITGVILCSCGRINADLKVIDGNDCYGRGDPDSAIAAYLEANVDAEESAWVRYNIACAYLAKGAAQAALELLTSIDPQGDEKLSFLTRFNEGCAELSLERWDRAWYAFREALLIDPDSVDAKKNAEYADERRRNEKASSTSALVKVAIDDEAAVRSAERLIRRIDEARWRSLSEETDNNEAKNY